MTKKGLIFSMNIKPSEQDGFLVINRYRFIPEFGIAHKTIIELEIYPNKICVVSFYSNKRGKGKDKYKVRLNYGPGHIKSILKSTLTAFFSLGKHEYAFVFSASNDLEGDKEYNDRYSAYQLFLEGNYLDFNDCYRIGSISLNTHMIYHKNYEFKDEADLFYRDFEIKIENENEESSDSK